MAAEFSMDHMMRAGCATRRAIRLWEEHGLLGPVERSAKDTRRYTAEQVGKAKIIAAAQFGNFELSVIKEMLEAYDSEVYQALMTRLEMQIQMAARLGENLPMPPKVEWDL